MAAETVADPSGPAPRGRCRCGHYPTHHLVTAPIAGTANFRLRPRGPCAICGEAGCRGYVPAGGPVGPP